MRSHIPALIEFVAAGLAATLALAQEPAFDPKAAAFIHKEGKATIEGRAFLRRPDNAVENAVAQVVRRIPVTRIARRASRSSIKARSLCPLGKSRRSKLIPNMRAIRERRRATQTAASHSKMWAGQI